MKNYFFWDDGAELPKLFKADGCSQCGGTGFRGRLGIHELFKVNQEVRDYILKGRTYNELRKLAYRQGFTDMRFDGFKKALQGLTTLEEIVRVTASDA